MLIGGGNTETLVENGVTQDDVGPYRVVTLSFLAGGGDGYPFPTGASANRVDLAQPENAPRTGQFDFAPDGSEQDAFAEYLGENFPVDGSKGAFDDEATTPDKDERITNLDF